MNSLKKSLLGLIIIATPYFLSAQRVIGYFDASLSEAGTRIDQMDWTNMTDFIYGFIQPDASGNLPDPTTLSHFNTCKTYCENNDVRMHFSSGGGGNSWIFTSIDNSQTSIDNYASEIADVLETHGLSGFDLDWEFPTDAASRTGHVAILKAIHDEFTARGKRSDWEIAIAVGGETPSVGAQGVYHTDYCNADAFQYIDHLNLMSYDVGYSISGSDNNHSSYDDALANIADWNDKGCPLSKMVLGLPLYARHRTNRGVNVYNHVYSNLSSADPAAAFNSNNVGDYYYNGKSLLEQKIDYIMNQGGAGVMVWEVTYDRTDAYSLMAAMKPYMQSNYGWDGMNSSPCARPSLGDDQSLCGVNSILLDADLGQESFRTFSWTFNGTPTGTDSPNLTITQAGTYKVTVDSAGVCDQSDEIVISNDDIPSIDLGSEQELCDPAEITISSNVIGPNYTYTWYQDNNLISESGTSLLVNRAGTYKLEVSQAGCTTKEGQVLITSLLIDVDHESICSGTDITININDAGSNYEWYTQAENGTAFHTGGTYNTPVLSNTVTYYIENPDGGSGNICDGVDAWATGYSPYNVSEQRTHNGHLYECNNLTGVYCSSIEPGSAGWGTTAWTDLGECGSAACLRTPVTVETESCTGIFENKTSTADLAYPNPTSDLIKVQSDGAFDYVIYDNIGTRRLAGNGHDIEEISLQQLETGAYILEVETEDGHKTTRVIKH